MILRPFKLLLAGTVVIGVATLPIVSQAQGTKSETVSKTKKDEAKTNEFEENRRTHTQKSKENNLNKGAN